jgi:hypothetical protein
VAVKKDLKTDEARRKAVERLSWMERREADRLLKCLEPGERFENGAQAGITLG